MVDEQSMEDLHVKVLASLGTTLGPVTGVKRIRQDRHKDAIADNPSKSYVLDGSGRRAGVLILSNEVNPDFVSDSVEKAALAKKCLGPDLGDVIIEPRAAGDYSGLSFVVWPLCGDLSSQRGLRYLQKRMLSGRALEWLRQMTEHTRAPVGVEDLDATYVRPLKYIADEDRLASEIRDSARTGIARIRSETWHPYVVLEHGDLWVDNFLLPAKDAAKRRQRGFVIIDWKGSNTRGYPVYDLLRLSGSVGLNARSLRREVLLHCGILACQPADACIYLLAALGNLGLNLEHFPVERYLSMCGQLYAYLKRS